VGERAPFDLLQDGKRVDQLRGKCLTGFIVSLTCPHCDRLAESSELLEEGGGEPIWIVGPGPDAAEKFAARHSLPPMRVYSLTDRQGAWPFPSRGTSIPFTPLRVVLDQALGVKDLSQRQTLPTKEEKKKLCGR
jgi:hypothetical protein